MQSVKNFFDKNGYFVFENLISNNKIDKICKEFNKFKLSNSIYYSQSEHNWRYTKSDLDEYAKWSSIPIINALTKIEHPCQALEDLLVLTKEDLSLTDDQIKNL